jgi:hypothetical protein
MLAIVVLLPAELLQQLADARELVGLLVLFQELGYGRLQLQRRGRLSDDGTPYPISHL